jgi:GLPGLI family protein
MLIKRNVIILLCFCFSFFYSQKKEIIDSIKQEFNYQYRYQPDSLNAKDVREEYFLLKVGGSKSLFVSENQNKRDSIMSQMRINFEKKQGNFSDFSMVPKSKFNFYILNEFSNKEISYYSKIDSQLFYYNEVISLNWKILSDKKNINGLECQLAEVQYGGRLWKAWFTEKIPLGLGPYKFYGLPGLIVEITDDKDTHTFSLIRYKYYASGNDLLAYGDFPSGKKVDKKHFLDAQISDKEQLVERFKMMGGALTAEKEREYRERLKRNNNPLELKN